MSHILTSTNGRTLTIQMNRPDKRNALTQEMYAKWGDALIEADNDNNIRAILIRGTDDCFTAGNDLTDFAGRSDGDEETPVARLLSLLVTTKKPIVAAVNGPAVGIGTTALLHCDIVVAADQAVFKLPFTPLGVCAEAASSFLMPMLVGHAKASELLLLGDKFSAADALNYGIVNAVTTEENYLAKAHEYCQRLEALPPTALQTTKSLLKQSYQEQITATMQREFKLFEQLLKGPESREAMTAFLEKRAPDFSSF